MKLEMTWVYKYYDSQHPQSNEWSGNDIIIGWIAIYITIMIIGRTYTNVIGFSLFLLNDWSKCISW